MASSKDRQRQLARAKLDRQMARRAVQDRRRRRIQAGVGAGLAVLLIVAGVAWLGGAFDRGDDPATDAAAQDQCFWTAQSAETNTDLKDVGTPPTTGLPADGVQPMTVTTDKGAPITVKLDVKNAPCAAAGLSYLASKNFYDNTECHEITTFGALRCGDPSGTGRGGPTYSFYNENVPSLPTPSSSPPAPAGDVGEPAYPKGTVALISDPPGQNGSQFLIFLKDYQPTEEPLYPIVGSVTAGADTLAAIGKIPTVNNDAGDKVKPRDKIVVKTLTVGPAGPDTPAPDPSNSAS